MPPPVLPHDVWLNIANYIPILCLRNLYPVNASLFHIALDARYRQISFIYWDDRLLRNLIRLKDPYVARRVKILHIYPGFLKEVMDSDARSKGKEKEKDRERHPTSLRGRLADITQQLREYQDKVFAPSRGQGERSAGPASLYDLPPRESMEKLRERLRTAQDVMHAVLDLFRSLRSLTDYYVTWYGLPTSDPFHSSSSSSSLTDTDALSLTNLAVPCIATPLLSPSLTKLSLDISLENIHALCSASFHVARLEHLHLHLHSDHQLSPQSLSYILNTRLAPSISGLAPFLRSLSIEAHEPMDVGPLFNGLDLLPRLDTVALALPLQKPHLGNPNAFGRFLRRQAETIKVLRLRATQHDAGSTGSGSHWRRIGTPNPWSLHSWIRTAFGSEAGGEYHEWFEDDDTPEPLGEYDLDALESLEVSSNLLPLETALYCAERFGSKVKTLGLLGSIKSFEFVKELVKVLGRDTKQSSSDRRSSLGSVAEEGDGDELAWQWLTPSPMPSTPTIESPINTNLRTLRIGPVPLSPELLDLLAHNLQSLQHLELIVKHFLPSQDDVPIYGSSRTRGDGDGIQLDEQVYEFLERMQNEWVWPWWGLKTISVYSESSTLSMPLPLPLSSPTTPSATTAHRQTHSQETTPIATIPAVPLPVPLSSSKGHLLSSSYTSSVTTITKEKETSTASRSSVTLDIPHVSSSAPVSRYPSITTPHPSSSLVLPCSFSMSALPLPTSHNDSNVTSDSSSLAPPRPSLQLLSFQSVSTPVSPVSNTPSPSSPAPAIHLPSASMSALPTSSISLAYNHAHPKSSRRAPGSSRSASRSQAVLATTPPLATASSTRPQNQHNHPMLAFLKTGSKLWKDKGKEKEKSTSPVGGVFNSLRPPGPGLVSVSAGLGSVHPSAGPPPFNVTPVLVAQTFGDPNYKPGRRSKVKHKPKSRRDGVGLEQTVVEKKGEKKGEKKRRQDVQGFDMWWTSTVSGAGTSGTSNPGASASADASGSKVQRKKSQSSVVIRTREHNRDWNRDLNRSSRDYDGEHARENDREWSNRRRSTRRKRRNDPLSSFGSVSSGISSVSGFSGLSGTSWGDPSEASRKDDSGGNVSTGGGEERITLEVALADVLGRCLPGVRVVR